MKKNLLFSWMKSFAYRYSETPFLLASGKESQHYFNCKEITLHPERLSLLAEVLVDEIFPSLPGDFQAVGGLTLGADPIAYALSLEFQKRGKTVYPLIVRKEAKDHGTGKQIEGFLSEVKTCVVLDDVITTGGSTLKAIQALRKNGIVVNQGICILDREEGGKSILTQEGVQMLSLFRKSDFF